MLLLNVMLSQAWGLFVGRVQTLTGAQELHPAIWQASTNAVVCQVPSPTSPMSQQGKVSQSALVTGPLQQPTVEAGFPRDYSFHASSSQRMAAPLSHQTRVTEHEALNSKFGTLTKARPHAGAPLTNS